MADGITVRIRNKDWRPRADIKHPAWFKCSNRILEDEDFYSFSFEEIAVWIHILSLASQKDSDTVLINFEAAERKARLKQKFVVSAIHKLAKKQVEIIDGQDAYASRTDDVRNTAPGIEGRRGEEGVHKRLTAFAAPTNAQELLSLITQKTIEEYGALYPSEGYVEREAIKAVQWCDRNSRRRPKGALGYQRFFASWLERGWEKERKSIATVVPHRSSQTGYADVS